MSNPFDDLIPDAPEETPAGNPFDDLIPDNVIEGEAPFQPAQIPSTEELVTSGVMRSIPDRIARPEDNQFQFEQAKTYIEKLNDATSRATTNEEFYNTITGFPFYDWMEKVYGKMDPAKAQNIYAMSQFYDLPISHVMDHYDELNTIGTDKYTDQLMNTIFMSTALFAPGGQALPFGQRLFHLGKSLLKIEAVGAGIGGGISVATGKPFKPFRLPDLLPETADTMTRTVTELIDMSAKLKAANKGMGMTGILLDKALYDTAIEKGLPDKIYVDPVQVERIFQGKATGRETDVWRDLGISADELRAAKGMGFQIEVPTAKVILKSDRPWFKDLKETFGVSPYVERTVLPTEGERKVTPVAGLLEEPGAVPAPVEPPPKVEMPLEVVQKPIPAAIAEQAKQKGIDPNTALAIASIETGGTFSPTIKNPKSSAYGIGQFLDSTWKNMGGTLENRSDTGKQIELFTDFLYQNTQALTKTLGRAPESWEVYLAHQQGAGGASSLLKNPEANAIEVLKQVVKNDKTATDSILLNGGTPDMTAGQFTAMWQKKFDAKLAKVSGGVPPVMTREKFVEALNKNPKIPAEQKDAFLEITDAVAASWAETYKRTPEEWYSESLAGLETGKARAFEKGMLAQPAFHGSPYKFDKFSLEHIGKGEGAQSFGWGLYFAGLKDVGEFYRNSLTMDKARFVRDSVGSSYEDTVRRVADEIFISGKGVSKGRAREIAVDIVDGLSNGDDIAHFRRFLKNNSDVSLEANEKAAMLKGLDIAEKYTVERPTGQLYKVEVPDDSNLLDWGKPLSGQNDKVKDAAKNIEPHLDDGFKRYISENDVTGQQLYNIISKSIGGDLPIKDRQKAASDYLLSQGISGHKYPAGTLGGGGGGKTDSYNYVIYDDEAVKVLETYYQDKKGAVQFLTDTRAIIHLFETGDVSTLIHELGHVLRRQLSPEDMKVIEDWLGIAGGGKSATTLGQTSDKMSGMAKKSGKGDITTGQTPKPEGGETIEAYHGAWTDTTAKAGKFPPNSYFTSSPEMAGSYTAPREVHVNNMPGKSVGMKKAQLKKLNRPHIFPVRISLKKPLDLRGVDPDNPLPFDPFKSSAGQTSEPMQMLNLLGVTPEQLSDALHKTMPDDFSVKNGMVNPKNAAYFMLREVMGYYKDAGMKNLTRMMAGGEGEKFSTDLANILKALGFDGVIFKDYGVLKSEFQEKQYADAYVVFSPDQIKSPFSQSGPQDQGLDVLAQGGETPPSSGTGWTVEAEEKFARAFEAYIMEGKAPSSKLRDVFAKLRKWLLDIYKSIKNLKVELTDEVRAVFDRLLSTEEQRKANVLYQMIEDYPEPAKSPIPAGAIKEYEQLQAEAMRRAVQAVEKDFRKAELQMEAGWRKQAQGMYEAEPVVQIKKDAIARGGFNHKRISRDWDRDTITQIVRRNPGLITKAGKLALDTYAAETNFESGDALMETLINFPSRQDYIENFVEQGRRDAMPEREYDTAEYQLAVLDKEVEIFNEMLKASTKDWQNITRTGIKRAIIENTSSIKVSDAKDTSEYHNLKAAMKMAEKASREAFRAGKIEQALKDKIKQAENAARLRDRLAARKEYQGIKKELVKALNDKKVDWDYREQMIQILSPFNMRAPKTPKKTESLSEFVTRKEAEGEVILFDPAEIAALSAKKLHELSMEELRTLRDVVKHIHYIGASVNSFLGAYKDKSITEAATEIAQTIYDTARSITDQPHPLAEKQKTLLEKFTGKYKELAFEQIKIEFLFRYLDNFQNFGPMTRFAWQPIKKAEDAELTAAKKIFEPFTELLNTLLDPKSPVRREWKTKKIAVPGTGFFVTKEQAAAVYSNALHPDNLRHLRMGFAIDRPPLSDDEIRSIIGILTPEERTFVDKVISDIIPLAKKGVWDTHKALTGVPPTEVVGKYMPLKFDPRFSGIIEASENEKAVKGAGAFKDFFPPSLQKGMTITRKSGGAKAIRTDFLNVVAEHLTEAIRYGSYGVALRDTLKIVNHPLVKKAIEETLGPEAYQQIRPWLKETINPGTQPVTKTERLVNHIRNNYTYFVMCWRVSTILIQPTAVFNSVPELGFATVMKSFGSYIKSPASARLTHEFITEKSPFMGIRTQSFDRDLYAAMGQFDPAGLQNVNFVKQSGFYLISLSDRLVTEPVWMAAYSKALNGEVEGVTKGDDTMAVEYADGVVRRTQSSGLPKDLAGIQRGGVWQKMLVSQFFTFFNAVHNLLWEAWQKKARGGSWFDFIGSYWWIAFVPALFGAAMQERRVPKDGADLFKMIGKAELLYQAGRIPLLRDFANVTLGGYDYRAGALGATFDEAAKAYKIATKGKRDKGKRLALSALKFGGMVTGLPPDQAIIAMQGALDLASGKTKNPARLLFRETKPD